MTETKELTQQQKNEVMVQDWEEKSRTMIADMVAKYSGMNIPEDDKEAYNKVEEAHRLVKKFRIAIDKKREELKADALKWGKMVQSSANRLFDGIEPIESELKATKKAEDDRKEKIKEEKKQIEADRIASIQAKITNINRVSSGLAGMTSKTLRAVLDSVEAIEILDEEYEEFAEDALFAVATARTTIMSVLELQEKQEREDADRKAESERLEKVRLEQAEAARKLKVAQDKIEKEQREMQVAKDKDAADKKAEQAEAQKKIDAAKKAEDDRIKKEDDRIAAEKKFIQDEKDKIEDEKKDAKEKLEREEFENKFEKKAAADAKIKAEQDAKEKYEKDIAEAEQLKEKRIADLKKEAGLARHAILFEIGGDVPASHLEQLTDKDWTILHDEYNVIWNEKQNKIFLEGLRAKAEADRIAKEKAASDSLAEEKRLEALRPDKERLLSWIENMDNTTSIPGCSTDNAIPVKITALFNSFVKDVHSIINDMK